MDARNRIRDLGTCHFRPLLLLLLLHGWNDDLSCPLQKKNAFHVEPFWVKERGG